ncbi:MAG: hypothetical protein NC117_00800 [Pseudoflavonifractor sp.]|nr:hypothetical protein [Pseudoflavonifractor sp.]
MWWPPLTTPRLRDRRAAPTAHPAARSVVGLQLIRVSDAHPTAYLSRHTVPFHVIVSCGVIGYPPFALDGRLVRPPSVRLCVLRPSNVKRRRRELIVAPPRGDGAAANGPPVTPRRGVKAIPPIKNGLGEVD